MLTDPIPTHFNLASSNSMLQYFTSTQLHVIDLFSVPFLKVNKIHQLKVDPNPNGTLGLCLLTL